MMPVVLFLFCMLFFIDLKPILDGRVTPIYLENRYTFTNFEWAKGRVYFKNGFDVPINGTAILDILDEPVDGDINLNGGTLSLRNNLRLSSTITGSGFIDGRSFTLFLRQHFDRSPYGNTPLIFTSSTGLEGESKTTIVFQPWNTTFTTAVTDFALRNITLMPRAARFNTSSTRPGKMYFQDSNIFFATLSSSFITIQSQIIFIGQCRVNGFNGGSLTSSQSILIRENSFLLIDPEIVLKANLMKAGSIDARLILDNAKLEYIFSGTTGQLFSRGAEASLVVRGKSELKAPLGSELVVNEYADIVFESGSRLAISPGMKLSIL